MTKLSANESVKVNYDHYYTGEDSEWRRLGAIDKVGNIVSLCNGVPHSSILEIGAGDGSILDRLSELRFGDELHAIDVSTSGIDTIRRRGIPRLAECMVFDGERIPYADDRFDLAIMSHVVEHVEHPRQLIKEAARVARYVFVEVPMEDNIRLPPDFMIDKVGHINFYSPKTLRRLIQTCGLSVLSQITTNASKDVHSYYGGVRGRINFGIKECLLKIAPNISPWLFTYHGSLLCTRTSSLR